MRLKELIDQYPIEGFPITSEASNGYDVEDRYKEYRQKPLTHLREKTSLISGEERELLDREIYLLESEIDEKEKDIHIINAIWAAEAMLKVIGKKTGE